MTKKVLALLLSALLLVTLMAGCTNTGDEWSYYSVWVEDDNNGDSNDGDAVDGDNANGDNADGDNADGDNGQDGGDSQGTKKSKTSKTSKTKTSKTKKTTTAATKKGYADKSGQTLSFTPLEDAGANYNIKCDELIVAVDTVRPTDYDAMFDVLKKLYPNINIKFEYWTHGSYDDGREYMQTNTALGKGAHIMWDEAGEVPTYLFQGWIRPITKHVEADPEAKYIPNNIKESYTYEVNGKKELFAVSHQATFEVIAFNTKLIKDLGMESKMPGLEWSPDDYQNLLAEVGANGFEQGICVGIDAMESTAKYIGAYYGKENGGHFGPSGFNINTRQYEYDGIYRGAKKMRTMRELPGLEGWFVGSEKLREKLGVNSWDKLWASGKSFAEETLTAYIEKWDEKYPNLEYKMWTTPNKNGDLNMHPDHCLITNVTPDSKMDAAYQVLRFMTFTTNGNLARLSMYDKENAGKYVLNSHVYYPTTTSEKVLEKFKSLPGVDEVDVYIAENMKNSSRYDLFKFVPGISEIAVTHGPLQKAVDAITDGNDSGPGAMQEAQNEYNKKLADYAKNLKTEMEKYYK